jgi:hypothetical protein
MAKYTAMGLAAPVFGAPGVAGTGTGLPSG